MLNPSPPPQATTLIEPQELRERATAIEVVGRFETASVLRWAADTIESQRQALLTLQDHFCIRCHHRWTTDATNVRSEYCGDCRRSTEPRRKLLGRYLDNHSQHSDIEGVGALCECPLCLDTRKEIGL